MLITRGISRQECKNIICYWYDEWPETFRQYSVDQIIDQLFKGIYDGIIVLYLVYEGSTIVSSACVCLQTQTIINILTCREHRYMGYGTTLIRHIIHNVQSYNIERLKIQCNDTHLSWLRDILGFDEDGKTEDNLVYEMSIDCKPMSPILKNLHENE
jgi:GNAT superfamily N-acetyltransferase